MSCGCLAEHAACLRVHVLHCTACTVCVYVRVCVCEGRYRHLQMCTCESCGCASAVCACVRVHSSMCTCMCMYLSARMFVGTIGLCACLCVYSLACMQLLSLHGCMVVCSDQCWPALLELGVCVIVMHACIHVLTPCVSIARTSSTYGMSAT